MGVLYKGRGSYLGRFTTPEGVETGVGDHLGHSLNELDTVNANYIIPRAHVRPLLLYE